MDGDARQHERARTTGLGGRAHLRVPRDARLILRADSGASLSSRQRGTDRLARSEPPLVGINPFQDHPRPTAGARSQGCSSANGFHPFDDGVAHTVAPLGQARRVEAPSRVDDRHAHEVPSGGERDAAPRGRAWVGGIHSRVKAHVVQRLVRCPGKRGCHLCGDLPLVLGQTALERPVRAARTNECLEGATDLHGVDSPIGGRGGNQCAQGGVGRSAHLGLVDASGDSEDQRR